MIRTFVSIKTPGSPELEKLMERLSQIQGIRTSPANQLHITLRFIGDVDESKVPRIVDSVSKACDNIEPFHIKLKGMGAFPNEKRPSVIWVGATPIETLTKLSDGIARELDRIKVRFDDKPFKPHITVARCRDAKVPSDVFEDHRETEFVSFDCSEVLVMKSVLGPQGAKHSIIDRVQL